MLRFLPGVLCLTLCPFFAAGRVGATTVVDFESLGATLAPNSAYIGADGAGGFSSQGATFNNSYNPAFGSWVGNAYSNRTLFSGGGFQEFTDNNDTVVAAGVNADGSSKPRIGADGSASWGIANSFEANTAVIEAPNGAFFDSLFVNNTATVDYLLRNGNAFSDPFGGPTGSEQDLFTVRFNDLSPGGSGFVEFILADYRFENSMDDYIVTDWQRIDLAPLNRATRIGIEFTSTDVDPVYGINTPTYVALDNITFESLTAVPEPGTTLALACFGGVYAWRRQRKVRSNSAAP